MTSGPVSVVPDPPAWPTLQHPIDTHESSNNFRPPGPGIELEYSPARQIQLPEPMTYRGFSIDRLGPFSVESAQAVPSGIAPGMHPGSGDLLNGPDSEQLRGFSEANTIGFSEDVWVPFVRPGAGQTTSRQPLGSTGARVEVHPPTHAPGRGQHGMCCIGERGEEVELSNGGMNRAP